MIPSAELRVYRPIDSFLPEEQARWERWLIEGRRYRARARYRQVVTAPGVGFMAPAGEGASVRIVDGRTYLAPDLARLRSLAAMLSIAEAEPFDGAASFLPRAVERRARREFARMRRRRPDRLACVMESPWSLPPRWLLLFDDTERRLVAEPRPRLSYLTKVRRAVGRIERVVPILRASEFAPSAQPLLELHRWISSFPPTSLVELDLAGLCDLVPWEQLAEDHGARDMADAVDALASGERARSAELVGAVERRWSQVGARAEWN